MFQLEMLEKVSGRCAGDQHCSSYTVPQLVQKAVTAPPEGAAPAKSGNFFEESLVTERLAVLLHSSD